MRLGEWLGSSVPGSQSWTLRLFGWGVGLAMAGGMALGMGRFQLQRHAEACLQEVREPAGANPGLLRAQLVAACIDQRAVFPANVMFRGTRTLIEKLPATPCEYVGTWRAVRTNSVYRIVLRDDGRFEAAPLVDDSPTAGGASGDWGVADGKMVWLYDEGMVWPPDVNPIHPATPGLFLLDEVNGQQTSLMRIAPPAEGRCAA